MGDNKKYEENISEDISKQGRNRNPDNKMDIDPNMGGPFSYTEDQENESVHTIPDDSLNLASRKLEGVANQDRKARDSSGNKD